VVATEPAEESEEGAGETGEAGAPEFAPSSEAVNGEEAQSESTTTTNAAEPDVARNESPESVVAAS
jgi:hypothetical protein